MVRPKLGSLFPGTAKLNALIEVSSKRRAVSNRSSFGTSWASPAGFHTTPEASSATPTKAPPNPIVRAVTYWESQEPGAPPVSFSAAAGAAPKISATKAAMQILVTPSMRIIRVPL